MIKVSERLDRIAQDTIEGRNDGRKIARVFQLHDCAHCGAPYDQASGVYQHLLSCPCLKTRSRNP